MVKIAAMMGVIATLALMGFGTWYLMSSPTTEASETIIIGITPYESTALIYIAEDQGYFSANGLNVQLQNYETGLDAVNGMKHGEVNISASAEYPIVAAAFNKEKISIIASIDKIQSSYLLCRRDRGIENISDLKGKKIGVSRGTIPEFYLGRVLDLNDISQQDVHIVDIKQSQAANALVNGSVDAIVARYDNIDPLKQRLGSDIVAWPAQSSYASPEVMACKNSWLSVHHETANRLIKSLDLAEEYLINHPDEAKAVVQKRLNYSDAFMATIWPHNQFSLYLDQSLITAMEDEGRWMINNNLTAEKTILNFRNFIYSKGLEVVKPESINIW